MYRVVRSSEEIDKVMAKALKSEETGQSVYPGMTYEQGVVAAIDWLTQEGQEVPFDDLDE